MHAHEVVAREKIALVGLNGRLDYRLPRLLQERLTLLGQLDMQRFFARSLPAWGLGVPGVGFTLWQRGAQEFHSYGSGGMVLGKVDAKEDFRLGIAELGGRYCYGFSQQWALVAALRQQFYFDPEGFFTATLLALGVSYVF